MTKRKRGWQRLILIQFPMLREPEAGAGSDFARSGRSSWFLSLVPLIVRHWRHLAWISRIMDAAYPFSPSLE